MAEPTDGYEYEEGDDEEVAEATSAPRREGPMVRLERLLAPKPPPPPKPGAKGRSTKWSIDRIDARERVYCYGASLVAVFFAVLVYVVETNDHHLKLSKGQFTPTTTLLVGVAGGVLLAVTTYIGRRALVGFMALFVFLGFSNSDFIVGLPFLILAAWLLYRSYKVQKEATAKLRADRAAGGTAEEGRTGRTPRTAASGKAAAEARAARRKKGPAVPAGNKRYTPKKPTPPPPPTPKQSRRERRAAEAAD